MAIFDRILASSIGLVPKFIVRRVAARYVAGDTLNEAVAVAQRLMSEGCCATFDLLGEFTEDEAQADASADAYIKILDRIRDDGLDANVSLKLTAFGLLQDKERTYERVLKVVSHAKDCDNFVRIDMEDSPWTDATFAIYRRLREAGFLNVGLVIQAYLKRTLDDITKLSEIDPRPSYRLCKGIYVEPEEISLKDDEAIRENYRSALTAMLDSGSYVGIATHDKALIDYGKEAVKSRNLQKNAYEFQMLLGVTDAIRHQLVAEGPRMRVYIPYGEDWYGYSVRRLKENPKIGRYVFLAMFKRKS